MEPDLPSPSPRRAEPMLPRLVLVLLILVLAVLLPWRPSPSSPGKASTSVGISNSVPSAFIPPPLPQREPLPGETLLAHYASPDLTVEQDLVAVSRVLESFRVLVKGPDALPLGSNEEMVAALRGKNPAHLRLLPPSHPSINDRGQWVDRWGTPLFFHARSSTEIDIRSAGPDRVLGTADDVQRDQNGAFERGVPVPSR